jgi:hypothetical protein
VVSKVQRSEKLFAANAPQVVENPNAVAVYALIFINRTMALMVLDCQAKPPAVAV